MKKLVLKLKILLTNISRIIMSVLFVNLNFLFPSKVNAWTIDTSDMTCYITGGPSTTTQEEGFFSSFSLEKVFIIAVPVVIVIALASFIIIKRKKSKKNSKSKNKEINQESKEK
jgi:hypothetical protein